MAVRRHTRLSGASIAANPPRQARSSLVQRARSAATSINEARSVIREKRLNSIMEKREINKFMAMAEKHCPTRAEIAAMDHTDEVLHLTKLAVACLLRASCTSRREIEQIICKVMEKLTSGEIYDDDITLEQTQTRVGNFLLGKYAGTSMVDTLVPIKFSETKALKKVFNHTWPYDTEFTTFAKIVIDKKRAWKFVLGIRQKMTERLNKMIGPLFVICPMSKKSTYDKGVGKAMTSLLAKYSVCEVHPQLPEPYLLEREYAMQVVIGVGLEKILKDWGGHYFLDVNEVNNESALIGMLNSRAQQKGAASLNLHFLNFLEKVKAIRMEDEGTLQRISSFPYSQSKLDVDLADLQANEKVDVGLEDKLVDNSENSTQSPPHISKSGGKADIETALPASQKRAWLASFDTDEESDIDLIELVESKEKKILPKPQLPYMMNKRKRKRVTNEIDGPGKRAKSDVLDGLPDLESLE